MNTVLQTKTAPVVSGASSILELINGGTDTQKLMSTYMHVHDYIQVIYGLYTYVLYVHMGTHTHLCSYTEWGIFLGGGPFRRTVTPIFSVHLLMFVQVYK